MTNSIRERHYLAYSLPSVQGAIHTRTMTIHLAHLMSGNTFQQCSPYTRTEKRCLRCRHEEVTHVTRVKTHTSQSKTVVSLLPVPYVREMISHTVFHQCKMLFTPTQ